VTTTLLQQRHAYAEELRAVAPIRTNEAIVSAFANVPREQFAGPGPWLLHPPFASGHSYRTTDDDPKRLYHNVLVSIDDHRDLNIGQPSLWARIFDCLALSPGKRVLQVGAGTGYYSAILGELVGRSGRVLAVEYDDKLAERATLNLAGWPQVSVVCGDGTSVDPGEVDIIIAFAGVTHPPPVWLDRLSANGELLMPLTGAGHRGFLLKLVRNNADFSVDLLGPCSFFHCVGARREEDADRLDKALAALDGKAPNIDRLVRGTPSPNDEPWYVGADFWIGRCQTVEAT
jgi:protein-L-isoaspartate(D-aspartate) O-methyltransferase